MTKRSGSHTLQRARRKQALAARSTEHVPAQTFREGGWHSPFCSAVGNPCPINCKGREGDLT